MEKCRMRPASSIGTGDWAARVGQAQALERQHVLAAGVTRPLLVPLAVAGLDHELGADATPGAVGETLPVDLEFGGLRLGYSRPGLLQGNRPDAIRDIPECSPSVSTTVGDDNGDLAGMHR